MGSVSKQIYFVLFYLICFQSLVSVNANDWPQWGGSNNRNMVSEAKKISDDFDLGRTVRKRSSGYEIDLPATRNVKWAAGLGSQCYGNPTVSGGKVFVGTNDDSLDDARFTRTRGGMVSCFSEETGKPIWQLVIPKFRTKDSSFNYDNGSYGVCSSPTAEGDFVYLVSNRGEVLCLDADGMADGNDGPFREEGDFMTDGKNPDVKLVDTDGDIIWRYDMIKELPVWPQDASNCSVLIYKNLLYVCTSNGVDKSHSNVPYPDAPSLIVLDKKTGRLVAQDDERIGHTLFHGQWSNPSMGTVNGRPLIFWGGGDGVCYAFEVPAVDKNKREVVKLKKAWSCDCNPDEYKVRYGRTIAYQKQHRSFRSETRGHGPCEIISTPVFYNNRVYVTIGQDPRHGRGDGAITCIDATGHGDITGSGIVWRSKEVDRSLSTPSIYKGLVYILDFSGKLHCIDADTGQIYWSHETGSPAWSSTLAVDGKIYFGNEMREFWILKASRQKEIVREIRLPDQMYNTPVVADGTLILATQRCLYAVEEGG